jgi:hypothetical protein
VVAAAGRLARPVLGRGGDAGGGNATMTFSYSNFNDLIVVDSNSGILAPPASGE